ncbi:MAG: hypothetical protein ACOYO1_05280 [Bacteroidales bacterium]
MKYYTLFFAISIIMFNSCSNYNAKEGKENNLTYIYIYNSNLDSISKSKPCDSLCVYNDSSYEKSLNLYKNTDSLCKLVEGFIYINIFRLYNEKYAILIDSTTKIYKFVGGEYKRLYSIPVEFGTSSELKLDKMDINSDGFKDLVLQLTTGGTSGDEYICLFYNPIIKTLIYDSTAELRDVEFKINEKKLISHYRWSSAVFAIEKYSFRLLEDHIYMIYSCNNSKYDNMEEVLKYDRNGTLIRKDTLKLK